MRTRKEIRSPGSTGPRSSSGTATSAKLWLGCPYMFLITTGLLMNKDEVGVVPTPVRKCNRLQGAA